MQRGSQSETWLRKAAGRHAELVGAALAGSTRTRAPEEPHPPSSDVDLFIYVDAEVPSEILEPHGLFAPRKLAFRGVVIEPSFHEARPAALELRIRRHRVCFAVGREATSVRVIAPACEDRVSVQYP